MEISSDDFNKTKSHLKINEKYYKIQKIIGKGAFGVVYKAFELCSGKIVAIKQIPVDSKNKKHVIKEIELLKGLDHPNIVKYYNYLKEEDNIYIIMEYLEGGTLKQYIEKSSQNINEDIAREIIKQLLNALSYLHYLCDICHRDIKPENIMFPEKNNISFIKLLDFGLSTNEFETKLKMQNCGTLTYMAPEQISNLRYSKGVDIWSIGIVLYMLLNKGKNPFYKKGDSTITLINNINNKNVEFDLEKYPISSMGRHFIYKLLEKNPSYRYTVRLALNHPWITLNKLDKIPMTIYDKVILDENSTKLKMLLLTSLLMFYYKKNNLIINNDINLNNNKDENNKNNSYENISSNDLFNMEIYKKNIMKINEIYEQKFKENREKMFLPIFNINKEINILPLKRYKNKA
jgi:serine/threonine protein kinase